MRDFEPEKNRMVTAINSFLKCLHVSPDDSTTNLRNLARAMDKLVAAYNDSQEVEPNDCQIDCPVNDYAVFADAAAVAFPQLGMYASVAPDDNIDQEIGLACAIDDLADIANDLSCVLWYFKQDRIADGVWDYRFGYQVHWGKHLHSLRNYLHCSTLAAW